MLTTLIKNREDLARPTALEQHAVYLCSQRRCSVNRITRLCDVIIACALIAFTLPLMVIVALAIKLDSPGPVFSREERLLRGRHAVVLKFRTVRNGPHRAQPMWRQERHLTRIGWFLGYTRIDNLPQFVNVLRGEMNLVDTDRERPDFLG